MVKFTLSIPNCLTLFRVILIPVLVLLLREPSVWMMNLAFWIFVVAAITDYLDGLIARVFGYVSDFGKLLDPLADKILVLSTLIMLVGVRDPNYGDSWVPAWMVVAVILREIWVTGLRGIAVEKGTVVAANFTGKVKSFLQMVAIGALLLQNFNVELGALNIPARVIGLNLLFISLFFSYWGAWEYTMLIFKSETSDSQSDVADQVDQSSGGKA
jgi:CDP-diacylglycerol--glycerol-3-phosphate 3-phosphatidyltransferase